jgi:hypothetical protein
MILTISACCLTDWAKSLAMVVRAGASVNLWDCGKRGGIDRAYQEDTVNVQLLVQDAGPTRAGRVGRTARKEYPKKI